MDGLLEVATPETVEPIGCDTNKFVCIHKNISALDGKIRKSIRFFRTPFNVNLYMYNNRGMSVRARAKAEH